MLKELEAFKRKDMTLVFTTTGLTPISGFSRAKSIIDKDVTDARKKKDLEPLAPWRVHDLRRTAATEMSRLGASRFIVARILNHTDREVTGIYDRNLYLAEKKAALDQWGSYLSRIVSAKPAKVASLPERRRRSEAAA